MILALFPKAWKGKMFVQETQTILVATSLQLEMSVADWNYVPLRCLPPLVGPTGGRRKVQYLHFKDEVMQVAARAGCGLTATRLLIAHRIFSDPSVMAPALPTPQPVGGGLGSPAASASSSSSQSSGSNGVALAGPAAMVEAENQAPAVADTRDLPRVRNQTRFIGPIMESYHDVTVRKIGKPGGPLRLSGDGVNADVLGERDSFWVI